VTTTATAAPDKRITDLFDVELVDEAAIVIVFSMCSCYDRIG